MANPIFMLFNIAAEMEIEERERVRRCRIQRKVLRDATDPFQLSEARFKQNFRLSKDRVMWLCERLEPNMPHEGSRGHRIRNPLKILIALKLFACGSYQRGSISENSVLNVSQWTVSRSLHQFLDGMERTLLQEVIKFPSTEAAMQPLKARFYEKCGLPGVVGLIDCTIVRIVKPHLNEEQYFSHKQCHGINCQIICDDQMQILNCNARHGGATHDSYIWRFSQIQDFLKRRHALVNDRTWLLGDSGYPLQPWLLTPIQDAHPGTPEARYSRAHRIMRSTVERCYGVMKMRWRCLHKDRVLHYDTITARRMINCVAALHNLALHDPGYLEVDILPELDDHELQAAPQLPERRELGERREGEEIRRNLIMDRFT